MKIKTRLKFNIWFSLGLIVLILLSLGWSFWEVYRTERGVSLVRQIEKASSERIVLRDDWILHRESRAADQWYAKTKDLQKLLNSASKELTNEEVKDLLKNAKEDLATTSSLLLAVIENWKKGSTVKDRYDFSETESRLLSQTLLKSYSLNDNINRLHEHVRSTATEARNREIILIIVFVIGGAIIVIFNSVSLNNIMKKQVVSLAEGMWVMGDGDLDYRINVVGNNELAYLAQAINSMAARLKQSYVSVDNLRKEIAERKRAEENIEMLTSHQQSLITAIPDIIMEVSIDKRYTWANGPGIEFFGDDVIGKEAAFYFVREQKTYDVVQPIFNGSEDVVYLESWQRRKDGQERLLAWWCRVLKNAKGTVTGALSSARDITDQKLASEKIQESEEKFRYIFDNSVVGKSITSPDGRITVNKALSAMLGYSQEEMNQYRWQDITHPDDVELTQKEIDHMLMGGKKMVRFTKRYAHKNGSIVWTDLSSSLRRDKDGKPLYLMSTLVDITQLKLAESQREAALGAIKKINEELEEHVVLRTSELFAKTAELERINKVFVDRELRMRELKARIAELEKK